jgi:hypothetical protein
MTNCNAYRYKVIQKNLSGKNDTLLKAIIHVNYLSRLANADAICIVEI